MDLVFQDFRLAARHVRKAWPFAAPAVVTLTLGIGANVMLFSLADSVLFRPFPLREADRLVIAGEGVTDARAEVSFLNFKDWQIRARAFDVRPRHTTRRRTAWTDPACRVGADGRRDVAAARRCHERGPG